MGKFIDRFRKVGSNIDTRVNSYAQRQRETQRSFHGGRIVEPRPQKMGEGIYEGIDENLENPMIDPLLDGLADGGFNDPVFNDMNRYGVGIQPAQKPESFHHFILENQYKDLEKSIRGYKDVFNKETREWETKRKDAHCFTDEEAEEILRTAQSHLATDIKLSFINKEVFGEMMMAIYKRLDGLFYAIAEYRYGRYGDLNIQYNMKLQNQKIFLELWTRVQANYSRAIQGTENRATHQSVQGQESLQQSGQNMGLGNRRYS